jgi:hypothetical protein
VEAGSVASLAVVAVEATLSGVAVGAPAPFDVAVEAA